MVFIIRKWLNKIEKRGQRWIFLGDGHDEFENEAPRVEIGVLKYFIIWCQEQIDLAEEYLAEVTDDQ